MDTIFDGCVRLLVFLAAQLGLTYKEINVWVFVIIWPIISIILITILILQRQRIQQLSRQLEMTTRRQ